jgi:hypothetical protein
MAGDDKLQGLWQFAIAQLAHDIVSQRWSPHIGIAERVMRERKIYPE